MPLAISIFGATGKMGKSVLSCALQDPDLCIVAGTASPKSPFLGIDLGELIGEKNLHVPITSDVDQAISLCNAAIDFSVREASMRHVHAAQNAKKALVIGTTGLRPEEIRAIETAAQDIPIILSANFSLGIALCLKFAALLDNTLFGQSTIDIFETHHIHKKDMPSGTALALAQAIGKGKQEIPIHSIRTGEVVGEHRLVLECGHERIEIKHTAHSREAFAQGALLAAKRLVAKPVGLYTLEDLFAYG
jgi:4-hydroxy-tetrahydrodipicolinate reductase